MQLVMGNLQFLMNEEQEEEHIESMDSSKVSSPVVASGSIKTITKGNDVPEQVYFSDEQLMRSKDLSTIQVVSVNLWFTNKHQISVIQVIYSDGKDCFLGKKSANVTGQMEKEVLQVDQGDYIKNIMGIFNKKGAI